MSRQESSADHFRHGHRSFRPHAQRTDGGSISHFDRARATARRRLNCALGPDEMEPYVEELARATPDYTSAYPNAGLPDPLSPTGFPETPETFAPQLREWARNGWLNIVGGCCGTTPDHIRAIAEAVRDCRRAHSHIERGISCARRIGPQIRDLTHRSLSRRRRCTSSLRSRTARHHAGHRFRRRRRADQHHRLAKIFEADPGRRFRGRARRGARQQVKGGANILDVNMDEGMIDSEAAMTRFLNLIGSEPEIARIPIMIDSSKWSVIEAGLKCVQGKASSIRSRSRTARKNFCGRPRSLGVMARPSS